MPDNNRRNSQSRSNRALITEKISGNMATWKVEEKESATNRKQWSKIVPSNLKDVKTNITSNTELSAENVDKTRKINRNTQNSSDTWVNVSRKKAPNDKVNMTCTGIKYKTDNTVFRAATSRKWFYIGKIAGKEMADDTIRDYLKEINRYESINIRKFETKGQNSVFLYSCPNR
ncbi:hypothetical protein WA026_008598 [Henosepilachna vigintioctopunctata]|uniref:Uncharacterized protein n=1 Tax=Henosepilachna vigintioctopunctata TaxID=420089 RepID=A0AAW1UIZ2_9CUCU